MASNTNSEDILCDECCAPKEVELTSYDDVISSCNQCGDTEVFPPEPEEDDIPF